MMSYTDNTLNVLDVLMYNDNSEELSDIITSIRKRCEDEKRLTNHLKILEFEVQVVRNDLLQMLMPYKDDDHQRLEFMMTIAFRKSKTKLFTLLRQCQNTKIECITNECHLDDLIKKRNVILNIMIHRHEQQTDR